MGSETADATAQSSVVRAAATGIGVFGSVARGDADRQRDIDPFVVDGVRQ
nr:nucleotidyltransferase domain-containing protein [Natrinema altunense]